MGLESHLEAMTILNETDEKLIVSEKAIWESEQKNVISQIKVGQIIKGDVTALADFGAFVKFMPEGSTDGTELEGLVHISEIAWEKVDDPTKFFKVGQKVEVMASAKDEEAGKLSLSAKQLAKDPFEEISAKYAKDQKVTGAVSKVVRGGIYITLEHGLEGFVLASKIPPNESWEAGKTVQCMVESVDVASRKITLVPYALEKPIFYR